MKRKPKLKLPAKSTLPVWTENDLAVFLMAPFESELRDRAYFLQKYMETFGCAPPERVAHRELRVDENGKETLITDRQLVVWDLRRAVFYEQSKRIDERKGKVGTPHFLEHWKSALAFTSKPSKAVAKSVIDGNTDAAVNRDRAVRLVYHVCGHKYHRAVTDGEHVLLEKMPCFRCAPAASLQTARDIRNFVDNHQMTHKEEWIMSKKTGKAKLAKANGKESPIGKGVIGKTSGLNKTEFYLKVLADNEKAPKAKKLTDEQIQKVWDAEFPDTASYPVRAIRARLNRGGYGERGFTSQQFGEDAEKAAPASKKGSQKADPPATDPSPTPEKKPRLKVGKAAKSAPAQA